VAVRAPSFSRASGQGIAGLKRDGKSKDTLGARCSEWPHDHSVREPARLGRSVSSRVKPVEDCAFVVIALELPVLGVVDAQVH
jgi:hypothetical protein